MAVYHLACRLVAEPQRTNPPARIAKWQQACALPSCMNMIWKGDTISCTRDNEHGHRKGAAETIPAPADTYKDVEPATSRDPFPILAAVAPDPRQWVAAEQYNAACRELDMMRATIVDLRNVLLSIELAAKGSL